MKRLLILHCGPMKTGSTVIQDTLKFHREELLRLGISYYHIRAKNLLKDLQKIISKEHLLANRILLLSSEFFCQQDPDSLKTAVSRFCGETHAILVSRPFREVYPSLYLQNLKGSSKRTTSFSCFLSRQVTIDMMNENGLGGQLMNAPALDARMSSAGFQTYWIRYDRQFLLNRFFDSLQVISNISLNHLSEASLEKPLGLSPRRSLRMELAGLARAANYLNRFNILSEIMRERFFVFLLDVSECMNRWLGTRLPLSQSELELCNEVDRLVNQEFLNQL